jgi:putative intracellular protease/amidase/methionine-rich copper-binding protein CopC
MKDHKDHPAQLLLRQTTSYFKAFVLLVALIIGVSLPIHAKPITTNFNAAMEKMGFGLDGDANGTGGENGIPDSIEMALLAAILKDGSIDLSNKGGVSHNQVYLAYLQAQKSAKQDIGMLRFIYSSAAEVTTAYAMLGHESFETINRMTSSFGAPLEAQYDQALSLNSFLSAQGDADGDGFTNRQEYYATKLDGKAAYIHAALNPQITPSIAQVKSMPVLKSSRLNVGIVLFPGFELLDVYGPLEMWGSVPDFNIILVAEKKGSVISAQGPAALATHSFENAPDLDILMVPGGNGTIKALTDPKLLKFIKDADATTQYTASVCTGSALLAKTGILDGHKATTNKRFFYLSEQQSDQVNWIGEARWVESGKYFTSSGVSAGTDMALGLLAKIYDKQAAKNLASSLEYQWHDDSENDPFFKYINRLSEKNGEPVFIKSIPADKEILQHSPKNLRLYFGKPPKTSTSNVKLFKVGHPEKPIKLLGLHSMSANDLMVSIPKELEKGVYQIEWQTELVGSDGSLTGHLQFTLDPQ